MQNSPTFATEAAFLDAATRYLDTLADQLEEAIGHVAEVDREDSTLTITLEDDRQFLLNRHAPNRQIWLSSPISGGWHFDWQAESQTWESVRDDSELLGRLSSELTQAVGQAVDLKI